MSVSRVKIATVLGVSLLLALLGLAAYLFRPLPHNPVPAKFHVYDLAQGSRVPLAAPPEIFAVGLSYASHIAETASEFDPDAPAPVFRKHTRTFVRSGASVSIPDTKALCAAADELEPGLGQLLREAHPTLSPLFDYEGELGFVLLQDIDPADLARPDFIPQLGFFITNDLSARTLAIMGEGQANTLDYWGLSKSFPGCLPLGDHAWVPRDPKANGIPSVIIKTTVNGIVRQEQSTEDLIYTPLQLLRFIHDKYPESPLEKDTIVLTGTPGGVALTAPRWLRRGADLFGMDRFEKLALKLDGDQSAFLKDGDQVEVSGGALGSVSVTITGNATPAPAN